MKVDKPAALGKASETEATLDTLPMDLDFLSNDFQFRHDLFDDIYSLISLIQTIWNLYQSILLNRKIT
jgi:hypothetical protein